MTKTSSDIFPQNNQYRPQNTTDTIVTNENQILLPDGSIVDLISIEEDDNTNLRIVITSPDETQFESIGKYIEIKLNEMRAVMEIIFEESKNYESAVAIARLWVESITKEQEVA